jgi:nudix-type nucleoside diphosphatase (YffH/AdpP family)
MSFKFLDEETIYRGRVFDLVRIHFQLPNGKEPTFDLVKHHGAVVILPVDQQGNIWFVRQFRIGAEQDLLELPAGILEKDEVPEASAARETQEEIGMAPGQLQKLGEFYMVPGYSTEKLHAFLATGLYASALPTDEDELLERVALPIQKVYEMARSGKIQDGKTLAVLFLAEPVISQLSGGKL